MKKYLIEFLGTFFLVVVIAFSGNPLAIGCILVGLVYMGGYISNAHYNPAVSLAFLDLKRMSLKDFPFYIAAQFAGALAASFLFHFYFGVNKRFVPAPDFSLNILKPFLIEAMFTFLLVLAIFHSIKTGNEAGRMNYGLVVGFTVMGMIYAGSGISGGVYNPAVGLAPLIVDALNGGNNLGHAWLYVAGPCLGAFTASRCFAWMSSEKEKN